MIDPEAGEYAMKRFGYTKEQFAFALKQAELGTPVPSVWQGGCLECRIL